MTDVASKLTQHPSTIGVCPLSGFIVMYWGFGLLGEFAYHLYSFWEEGGGVVVVVSV